MRQTLRRFVITAATVGAAGLLALGSASPAAADGNDWGYDWDQDWVCNGFSLGDACIELNIGVLDL